METEPSAVLGYENGRYYVSLTENLVTNRYDVTAHVNKLIGNSIVVDVLAEIFRVMFSEKY